MANRLDDAKSWGECFAKSFKLMWWLLFLIVPMFGYLAYLVSQTDGGNLRFIAPPYILFPGFGLGLWLMFFVMMASQIHDEETPMEREARERKWLAILKERYEKD